MELVRQETGTEGGRACREPTKAGKPCAMPPLVGSDYCYVHDPALEGERALTRSAGGQAQRTGYPLRAGDALPELRTVEAVQSLIERTVFEVQAQCISTDRARAIGYLATVAARLLVFAPLAAGVDGEVSDAAMQRAFRALEAI